MRRRPGRSVIRMAPSGRNAMLNGCTSPLVIDRLRPRAMPVSNGMDPAGSGGDGQLMPFGAFEAGAFALPAPPGCWACANTAASAAAAAQTRARPERVFITDDCPPARAAPERRRWSDDRPGNFSAPVLRPMPDVQDFDN